MLRQSAGILGFGDTGKLACQLVKALKYGRARCGAGGMFAATELGPGSALAGVSGCHSSGAGT